MNTHTFLNIVVIANRATSRFIIVVSNRPAVLARLLHLHGASVCVGAESVLRRWSGVREAGSDTRCDAARHGVGTREGEILGIENGTAETVVGNEVVGIAVDSVGWGSLAQG